MQLVTKLPCKDQVNCQSSDAMTEYDNLWYCFSCQKTFWKEGGHRRQSEINYCLKKDLPTPYLISKFPLKERTWLTNLRVTPELREKFKIQFNAETNTIFFPFMKEGVVQAYYSRGVLPRRDYYYGEKQLYFTHDLPVETLVLVEDIISAIRVSKFIPAAAVCTSSIGSQWLSLVGKVKNIILWYDPDRAGKKGMLKDVKVLERNFKILGKVRSNRDPKNHTDEEIENYLIKYMRVTQ